MGKRLVSDTLVRINGLFPEVENKYGIIVGYADENPIVQLVDAVSNEYPFTTLVVPEKCIFTKDKMDRNSADWHMFETEEEFDSSVRCAGFSYQLQVQFSRKIHRNLMSLLWQTTGVFGAPDTTLITTIRDNSNGHYRVCDTEDTGHYIFELMVDLRSYPAEGRHTPPWSTIKFEIMYPEWVIWEEDEWFNPENWQGNVNIKVGFHDKQTQEDEQTFCGLTSSQNLDKDMNMQGVVANWQKMYMRAQEMMRE